LNSIPVPASDFSNTTKGTEFGHVLTTIYPTPCAQSGWLGLGELAKLVPLSTDRFSKVECTPVGIRFAVIGTPGETVDVTAIDANGIVRKKSIQISQRLSQHYISFGDETLGPLDVFY
jgi:hypothetical protein